MRLPAHDLIATAIGSRSRIPYTTVLHGYAGSGKVPGFALLILQLALLLGSGPVPAKDILGWVEHARLYPGDIQVKAKLDTGAKNSSLHCTCTEPFERDGVTWVRFQVENSQGGNVLFERPVERIATIRRHFGETQERLVVRLGICLETVYRDVEVNLVDRGGLDYQLLVGRSFLQGEFLVDPERTFTGKPRCRVPDSDLLRRRSGTTGSSPGVRNRE